MKKFFTLILFSTVGTLTTMAQSSGFYHVKNNNTGRYMVMCDNSADASTATGGQVDMAAIRTNSSLDEISEHAGSVFYLESKGGEKYDIKAQGTGIGALTNNRLAAELTKVSDGTYKIHGTYKGVTVYLADRANSGQQMSNLIEGTAGGSTSKWELYPIDNSTHYIGVKPDVKTSDGTYWATFYCGFAFKLSSGMKAYYVDAVDNSHFHLKEYTGDIIPATMPVIIRCNSNDPSDNKVLPQSSGGSEPRDNNLYGVYFDSDYSYRGFNHVNHKAYDSSWMRVLGASGNDLVFEKASSSYLTDGSYLPHNKCYLEVPSSAASTLTNGNASAISSVMSDVNSKVKGTYTLTGQRIPEGTTLRHGVYIRDGKKIIIK